MKKSIKSEIHLLTPSGKTLVPIQINYDDDENLTHPLSEISVIYSNNNYTGKGTDYLWVDTFADLQVKLPQNVKIACCMTCRHGNICPYGNRENELFCTKDILIHNKSDILDLFDESDPFSERLVSSLDFCHSFVYQSDEYYTYNDYLLRLQDIQNN